MNARFWFGIALAASVVLNAVFLVGYLRATDLASRTATPTGRAQMVAERLRLDTEQSELFNALRSRARQLSQDSIATGEPLAGAFWDEMARDIPDRSRLSLLVSDAAQHNMAFNEGVTDLLLQFLESLSSQQRAVFIDTVRAQPILRGRFLMSGQPSAPTPSRIIVANQRTTK